MTVETVILRVMAPCSLVGGYPSARGTFIFRNEPSTLKTEAACSSETPVSVCKSIWCHNPEYHNLNCHC